MPGNNNFQKIMNSKVEANLTQTVYHKIKEMMSNYDIIPGQRLVFVDLANQLGVSRTPVNNALSILASEGFLDFVPHHGYTVHQITKEEAEYLYEVREIMELGAIGNAIRRLTPEKRNDLERQKTLYERAVTDRVSRGRFILDQEFHACYVRISGNHYLADYFKEVYQRIFLRHRIEGLGEDRAQEVVREHEEIFNAICLRDIEGAKELIRMHIRTGKNYIFSVIFDGSGENPNDRQK
jgi:DNA-binding GntR family transcriptional regulator